MFESLSRSDWIGILGIAVSVAGFLFSIVQIYKTKSAADSAKSAAEGAQTAVRQLDGLFDFTDGSKALESLKVALQKNELNDLQMHFSTARKSIISAKEKHANLTIEQKNQMDAILTFLRRLEVEFYKPDRLDGKLKHDKIAQQLIDAIDHISVIVAQRRV